MRDSGTTPTYADSTTTRFERWHQLRLGLRMYVLARFPDNANLDWVRALRAKLGRDEVKHADVLVASLAYPGDKRLWADIERGVGEATIYVVDPQIYVVHLLSELFDSRAVLGIDFQWKDVLDQAAVQIIENTPGYELTNQAAAVELANLTHGQFTCGLFSFPLDGLSLPLPADVLKKLGGKILNAVRFAARAYSIFDDTDELNDDDFISLRYFPSLRVRLRQRRISSSLMTPRIFDEGEDPVSLCVLADSAEQLVGSMSNGGSLGRVQLAEADSRQFDALQAADIAAGSARDIIDNHGIRALANRFRHVIVNGASLHSMLK